MSERAQQTAVPVRWQQLVERGKALARERRAEREAAGLPVTPAEPEPYRYERDAFDRDISIPVDPERERRLLWETLCSRGGLSTTLLPLDKLRKGQRQVLEALLNADAAGVLQGGRNAVLVGPAGRGKTQVALRAGYVLHMAGMRVMPITWRRLKERLTASFDSRGHAEPQHVVLEGMREPDILLLDEVGYEAAQQFNLSQFDHSTLFGLVSDREAAGKFTWLTTNLTVEAAPNALGRDILGPLEAVFGEAFRSRLQQDGKCVAVDFGKGAADIKGLGLPNFRWAGGKDGPA